MVGEELRQAPTGEGSLAGAEVRAAAGEIAAPVPAVLVLDEGLTLAQWAAFDQRDREGVSSEARLAAGLPKVQMHSERLVAVLL